MSVDTCPACGHALRAAPAQLPLTTKQATVLRAIRRGIAEHGAAPTYSQLARELGFSSLATIADYIGQLERKGYLTRVERGKPQSIALVPITVANLSGAGGAST